MFHWYSRFTLNQRLAALAFVLGVAAIGATPTRQGTVSVRPQDLALIVQRDADHVSVRALADRLVKGQADFRVIDVRDEAAFAAYHLPGAENVPLAVLASANLPKNEKLLLYGDDGVHAAHAWFLLKAQGYPGVYTLRGGLAEWQAQVMSPVLPPPASAGQRRENEERAAVAAHFGGAARVASDVPAAAAGGVPAPTVATMAPAAAAAPPVAAPSLPAATKAAAAKPAVKKKEGC